MNGRPNHDGITMDRSGNVSIRKAARRDDRFLDNLWKEVDIMPQYLIYFAFSFFLFHLTFNLLSSFVIDLLHFHRCCCALGRSR